MKLDLVFEGGGVRGIGAGRCADRAPRAGSYRRAWPELRHTPMYLQNDTFVRTIPIPTLGVRTTEFDLSAERADALFESGRKAASTSSRAGISSTTSRPPFRHPPDTPRGDPQAAEPIEAFHPSAQVEFRQ